MKFVCDRCQTRYSIADEKVRQRILRIRCKTCGNVITVQSGEVIPGPQDASRRPESGAGASAASSARPSSGLARAPASPREWFVAVDGREQGPLSRTDAAKHVLSLKPEQSVRVWKEGIDGWKRPKDVAIIAQEISALGQAPAASTRTGSSSAPRPVAPPADSVSGVRAPGSRPKPLPAVSSGSSPKLSQPGPGLKSSPPVSGSVPKVAPPPIPGSGPKAVPPPIPGSGPKAVPPAISGSAPKLRPSVPLAVAKPVPAGGSPPSVPSLKHAPSLPGVTPMTHHAHTPALETEFDKAPATRPEKRPTGVRGVVAASAHAPDIAQETALRESLSDDEFDQAQKTPPSSHPLPPIVVPTRDVDEKNLSTAQSAWSHPPALRQPTDFVASGPAAAASTHSVPPVPSAGSLFGNVTLLPPEPWSAPHADAGPSKLTGLASLTHRHRHLKYVVAAGVVVVLVILVILLSWRTENGKSAPSALQPAAPAPEVPAMGAVETAPKDKNTATPVVEPKGRTGARVASRRPAVVHSAGPSVKAAAVGEDPFEGPAPSSRRAERPVPVVMPDQSHRSRSGPSGGAVREVSQSQLGEFVRSKDNQAGIKMCYERALKRDGRLRTGRLDITVSVGATGVVQNVQVHGPADFLIIESCIKNAIRHWHFPANVEEYATSFPFIMQGG